MNILDLLHSYTFAQLAGKVIHELKFRLYKAIPYLASFSTPQWPQSAKGGSKTCNFIDPHPAIFEKNRKLLQRSNNKVEDILSNKFIFAGEEEMLDFDNFWQSKKYSRLFMFNLHYLDWFHDLADGNNLNQTTVKNKNDDSCQTNNVNDKSNQATYAASVLDKWIDENPPGSLEGWHPYCISLRLVNIISLWPFLTSQFDKTKWLKSLYHQWQFLSKHNESFLSANHYFENAIALCLGDWFFTEDRSTFVKNSKYLKLLAKIVNTQIPRDGGHYEGSYGYHIRMEKRLKYLVNVLELTKLASETSTDSTSTKTIKEIIEGLNRMEAFSRTLCSNINEPPLFSDSWVSAEMADTNDETIKDKTCHTTESDFLHFEDSKLVKLSFSGETTSNTAIFSYKSPGSFDNPGHGHCDMTSYELFINGDRLVCDGGNYHYKDDELRHYFRSSSAHNVAIIKGVEQSRLFSAFRGGRKAIGHFKLLKNLPNSESTDELEPLNSFKLSYEPVVIPKPLIDKKLTITRKIDTSQSTLTISDYVQTQTNSPSCSEGKIQSLIHLVPDAKIITKNPETFDKPNIDSKSQMPKTLDIEFKGQKVKLEILKGEILSIDESNFAPDFGILKSAMVITLTGEIVTYRYRFL